METAIVIDVDGKPYETTSRVLTGLQIKQLAGVPPANLLYRVEGKHREQIGDTQHVHLHPGEHFVTAPPVGGAS